MSVNYYLRCKEHNTAVFITDNKGDPHERQDFLKFYLDHILMNCSIEFIDEYELTEHLPVNVIYGEADKEDNQEVVN